MQNQVESESALSPTPRYGVQAAAAVVVCSAIATGVAFAVGQGGALAVGVPVSVWCAALAFAINWVVFVPSFLGQTEHYFDLTGSATYILVLVLAVVLGGAFEGIGDVSLDFTMDWFTRNARLVRTATVVGLTAVWTLRLGLFLFRRVKRVGKDVRFDEMKRSFPRFLIAWTLQGLWVFLTLVAVVTIVTVEQHPALGPAFGVGVAIWVAGFAFEAVSDAQKTVFKRDKENAGRFIQTGLWSWSRHPNYFGEIVLWVGMAVIALPVLDGWRFVALISPVFVIVLLTKISGVPLLEESADERWGGQADYEQYKKQTSVLIPMPPRK